MIKLNSSESILQNFKSVVDFARNYYTDNIHTEMLESIDLDSFLLVEGIVSGEDDLLNEATNVTDAKIIHDGKGTAISVKVNGKEYRYVSSTKSTPELYRSFMGMLKHANAGYKALNWLKSNSLEYYGSKKPSEEGKKLMGLDESLNEAKYYRYNQLSKKAKDKANQDYFSITEDNDPEAAEWYYNNCNPAGQGGAFYFLKDGTPIYDEEVYESVQLEATQPGDIPPTDTDEDLYESFSREVIDTSKAGMSYYDEFLNPKDHDYKRLVKGLQGKIVYMSPDEYIDRLGKDIFKCSRERVLRGLNQSNVDDIRNKMMNGTKFDIPVLDLANRTQEGRHRAIAAKELGVTKIPVLVVTEWDSHKELGMPKCMNLWYGHTIQWTKKDGSAGELYVGLDLEKVKKAVSDIVKSGDYKP